MTTDDPRSAAIYPVQLRLFEQLCVVIGGGRVALRKTSGLLGAGARVRLIAPRPHPDLPTTDHLEVISRPYCPGDLEGAFLAFTATDSAEVNAAVTSEAKNRGIPINIADNPNQSDFTLPAVLRREEIAVAVSTGGASPALAALLRDHLEGLIGPEWGTFLDIASALRQKRLTPSGPAEYNQQVLRRLAEKGLIERIATGDTTAIDQLLEELLGKGHSLADLGVNLPKGMP